MNVDASVKKGTDIVGIGVVFTNCEGRIHAIHSLGRRRHEDPLLAEFEGLQIGLSLAIRYGFRRLKIVTDCLQLAQALQGVRDLPEFVERIRELHLSAFEDYSVVFQPKAANYAADVLASLAGKLITSFPEQRSFERAEGFRLAKKICIEDANRVPRFNVQFVPDQDFQVNKQRKTAPGKYIPRQSQERREQAEKVVALIPGESGFTLKAGDFDFSIKNWMNSHDDVRTPVKYLETPSAERNHTWRWLSVLTTDSSFTKKPSFFLHEEFNKLVSRPKTHLWFSLFHNLRCSSEQAN